MVPESTIREGSLYRRIRRLASSRGCWLSRYNVSIPQITAHQTESSTK
jgi:hypothetical protein